MIEMEYVGINHIGCQDQITHDPGVIRGRYLAGGIQGQNRGHAVGHRTDAADPLGDVLGIGGSPVYQDILKTAEEGAGGLGVHHLLDAVFRIHRDLDLEMPLQPGDGINRGYRRHISPLLI